MTSLSTMKASPICPTVGTSSAQRSRPSLGPPKTRGIVARSAAAQDVGFLLPLVVAEELRNSNKSCSAIRFQAAPRSDPCTFSITTSIMPAKRISPVQIARTVMTQCPILLGDAVLTRMYHRYLDLPGLHSHTLGKQKLSPPPEAFGGRSWTLKIHFAWRNKCRI